jgi:hypothetical protein
MTSAAWLSMRRSSAVSLADLRLAEWRQQPALALPCDREDALLQAAAFRRHIDRALAAVGGSTGRSPRTASSNERPRTISSRSPADRPAR